MFLSGRTALVTGSSRGIGRTIALSLAEKGARVIVNYVSSTDLAAEAVDEINGGGGEGVALRADVSKPDEVQRLVEQANERFGAIDILVNNAGIARDGLLVRMKPEDWYRVIDVNLSGAYHCTRAVLRSMLRNRWGRIINVTSVVGLTGNAGQANYAAAKAGLVGFTRAVAREVASRGITANAVAPGYIQTELTAELSESVRKQLLARIPLGSLGCTQDVAGLVVFLASPEAHYITGQVIAVDGGMTM